MSYIVVPIAFVAAHRKSPEDDDWGGEIAEIRLVDSIDAAALMGLDAFSHVEVLFQFHGVAPDKIVDGARHPRNNEAWPKVGIFAQRGKNRPNRIGSTICKLVSVDARSLRVMALDAIDGTPVLDIKPVMREFLPREATTQPRWATELMSGYWTER
jgi:tRNA (adenine37-N6)-methyltransferase